MAYQPGPLLLQSAGNVGVETSDYKFGADAHDQLSDLDVIHGSWKPFLDDAVILLQESSDPFPDVNIDHSILAMDSYSDPAALIGSDALLLAYGDAELGLGNAIAFSPLESWAAAPAPFVAPAPAEVLGVPVIPSGFLDVEVQGTVGGVVGPPPTIAGSHPASLTSLNLSQYGSDNFRVGDERQVTATGYQGNLVYAYANFNGNDIGGGIQGSIGSDGKWVRVGTIHPEQVGVWAEVWLIGSTQVAAFNYLVVDAE